MVQGLATDFSALPMSQLNAFIHKLLGSVHRICVGGRCSGTPSGPCRTRRIFGGWVGSPPDPGSDHVHIWVKGVSSDPRLHPGRSFQLKGPGFDPESLVVEWVTFNFFWNNTTIYPYKVPIYSQRLTCSSPGHCTGRKKYGFSGSGFGAQVRVCTK